MDIVRAQIRKIPLISMPSETPGDKQSREVTGIQRIVGHKGERTATEKELRAIPHFSVAPSIEEGLKRARVAKGSVYDYTYV